MTSLHDENEARLFALVNQNLRDIGCISIEQYLVNFDAAPDACALAPGLVKLNSAPIALPLSKPIESDSDSISIEEQFGKNVRWFTTSIRETSLYGGAIYLPDGNAYSTPAKYDSPTQAKAAVSNLAIRRGILALSFETEAPACPKEITIAESDPCHHLSTAIQQAQAKIQSCFLYIEDSHDHLYGAVLRVWQNHDEDYALSCIVKPGYTSASKAKTAVAALAISQGDIPHFIKWCQSEAENKITSEMRQYATRTLYNRILNEWKRAAGKESAQSVEWTYTHDVDAAGCQLRFDLPVKYSCCVDSEYRNRADAKVACAFRAVSDGVLELLRFRDEKVPSGYIPLEKNMCEAIIKGEKPTDANVARTKRKRVENTPAELEEGEVAEKGKKRRRKNKSGGNGQSQAVTTNSMQLLPPIRYPAIPPNYKVSHT